MDILCIGKIVKRAKQTNSASLVIASLAKVGVLIRNLRSVPSNGDLLVHFSNIKSFKIVFLLYYVRVLKGFDNVHFSSGTASFDVSHLQNETTGNAHR